MGNDKVIGYVLKGYGRTSETFISNEIELLERAGMKIRIFSLKELTGQLAHGVTQRITARVTYLPDLSSTGGENLRRWLGENWPRFAAAHRRLIRQHPLAWTATLVSVMMRARRGAEARRTALKEFLQAGFIAAEVIDNGDNGDNGIEGEIVHLHAHFAHTATTVTMLAARLCGRTFSFTAHAKDIYRFDMNPGDLLERKLGAASFTVTCTRANVDYLAGFTRQPGKIHRIYHGIDLGLFTAPAEERTGSPPLILAVGRFVEKKGFPDLVEACRILNEAGVDFRATIVGGFTEQTDLIQTQIEEYRLRDVVTLQPAMTQEQLKELYGKATLFVLPCLITADGDRDGIPNVLVEAMAEGLPVVSTNVSGIPELVRDGETGLLVESRNPVAIARAIQRLLDDEDLRIRVATAGRELVRKEFDARKNIGTLKRLFEQAIKEAGR